MSQACTIQFGIDMLYIPDCDMVESVTVKVDINDHYSVIIGIIRFNKENSRSN